MIWTIVDPTPVNRRILCRCARVCISRQAERSDTTTAEEIAKRIRDSQ